MVGGDDAFIPARGLYTFSVLLVADELDTALQDPSPSPLHSQPPQTQHTCVLADPCLGSHIPESQDPPGQVTGLRVHFNEGIRPHITIGIVSDVDGVSSGALRNNGRR